MERITGLQQYIDLSDPMLWASAAHIVFNPLFWNVAARFEYKHHFLTRVFGSARRGCYFLAVVIFGLGLTRDGLYSYAVSRQAAMEVSAPLLVRAIGVAFYSVGMLLVVTSTYQLGIVGTYLGDYFGILMEKKVTAFPYSILNSPMYDGSVLNFIGHALLTRRPAGLALTALVWVVYKIALRFEDSFTSKIYSDAAKNKKMQQQQQQQPVADATSPLPKPKPETKKAKQN